MEEDYAKNYPQWYLNRIKQDEWNRIIDKHFYVTINKDYLDKGEVNWKEFVGCYIWDTKK